MIKMKCNAGIKDCELCKNTSQQDWDIEFIKSEWEGFKGSLRLKEGLWNTSVVIICGIIWGWWGVIGSIIFLYISFNCMGGGVWGAVDEDLVYTKEQQDEWTKRCKKYG